MFHKSGAIFFIFSAVAQLCQSAIEPKVLLPFFGNYQINYTIDTDEGCYRWKSLREDVALISPTESTYNDDEKCSQSAIIVVTSQQPIRKTTLVLATNVKTGTIFQCDVIVDRIHEIDIVSRTRELYLADPPEELKIRALDQEGNTFSSTAGMEFEWSLLPYETSRKVSEENTHHVPVSAHSILLIEKFLDTVYVGSQYIDVLEKKGKMSDTILISGLQTGAAMVVANLISTLECHKAVKPSSVRFIVRDKVVLDPSHDVYLLKNAVIHYKVVKWREGVPTEVVIPSPQYVLNVRDVAADKGKIISLDKKTSEVIGLNAGQSRIVLIDQHLKHYDVSLMEQVTSDIYVCEPAYLKLNIEPHNRWILEVGKTYEITVNIYTKDNNQIWPSDNLRLIGTLDDTYFKIIDNAKNGTWFLVEALTNGSCDITSLLKGVVSVKTKLIQAGVFATESENLYLFKNPISTTQSLEIFRKISVAPSIVLFPWQPEEIIYRYIFTAIGGSGNYTWSVNETDASSIYAGEITIYSGSEDKRGPRIIEVKGADIRNSYHFGQASASLALPAKLQFALASMEAEVGTTLNLYVGMYAKIGGSFVAFTDCSLMQNLNWSIHDSSVFEFVSMAKSMLEKTADLPPQSPSCLLRQVHALEEGHTTVYISYHTVFNETLKTSAVIAAYNPLRLKDPINLAVVSLGSSKTLIFEGGPNPWPLLPSSHEKVIKGSSNISEFKAKLSGRDHTFFATCLRLGEVEVTFAVRNKPCVTNPLPRQAQVAVRLYCAVPASLKITTEYLPPSCPLFQSRNVQTVVLAGDTMQVTLSVYDRFGNQFDNFTSLALQWEFDSVALVNYSLTKSYYIRDSFNQTKHFVNRDVAIPNDLGGVDLQVILYKYEDFVDRSLCSPYQCEVSPPLFASIMLDVVSAVTILPQTVVLFNRPNYTSTIEIFGGSGHFGHKFNVELSRHVEVVSAFTTDSTDRSISLHPLSAGQVVLVVVDLCISKATDVDGAKPHSSVIVSDLSSLFLKVSNPLEVGMTGRIFIQLDMKQLLVPAALDIKIQLTSEPPDIVSLDQVLKGEDLVFYADVTGVKIGLARIKARTTSRDGKTISSNIAKITVFPPLMLLPPRVTLIRGSEFHFYYEGGPPEDVQVYYDVEDSKIASSSSNGVLTAHTIGNTTVKVRAITTDGQIFLGRSHSRVYVVQLTGALIDTPTHRFYTGSAVPIRVYGYAGPGYDPVNLDSDAAGLVFSWSVNNHAVLGIRSVHSKSGVQMPDKVKFTMLLDGKGQGQASVSVAVFATKLELMQLAEERLEAQIEVLVFDPFVIQNIGVKVWSSRNNLLITPETCYHLVANRELLASKIEYVALCKSCSLNVTLQDDDYDNDDDHDDDDDDDDDDDGCITVDDEQKSVTSGKSQCEATILITAQEQFDVVQTLAVHVHVKTVSYLLPEIKEKFYIRDPDSHLTGFPLGSKLSLEIQQFDSFGLRFDATNPEPGFKPNRNDLLEITQNAGQNTLRVRASKTGVTIFKIWSERNIAYDYPLLVISTIQEEETDFAMTIGARKCFKSSLVGPEGEIGTWSVNKPYSVAVNQEHGAVMPLSRLTGEIYYSLEAVKAKLPFISEEFSARFDSKLPGFITNAKSRYIFPIEISEKPHDACLGLQSEMIEFAKATFNCTGFLINSIEAVTIFEVSSTFAVEINSYACALDIVDLTPKIVEKISTFGDSSFTIRFTIRTEVADRGVSVQSPVNFRFLPAFKIMNSSEITITEPRISLCISATLEIQKSIQVAADTKNFEIQPPSLYQGGVICWELSYNINNDFTLKHGIQIVSGLTGQEEIVKIFVKLSRAVFSLSTVREQICTDPTQPGQPHSNRYWAIIIGLLIITLTTLLLFSSCGFLSWIFSQPPRQTLICTPGPRRSPPGLVPYSPSNSYLFRRSSPVPQATHGSRPGSPSPRRPQLWSSFYHPQDAGNIS